MKILVISDDYSEQKYLHTLMAKIGLVAESAANPNLIAEVMLGFNPDVIIVSGKSKKFEGQKVCHNLKKKHPGKKTILLVSEVEFNQELPKDIDGYLQAPVMSSKLIELLCELGGLDKESFLSKLNKVSGHQSEVGKNIHVKGNGEAKKGGESRRAPPKVPSTALSVEERKKRYSQFLSDVEPIDPSQSYPSDKIRSFNKSLRANQDLEAEKQSQSNKGEFVKALFEVGKNK